jgi:hypothetical protein
MESELETIDDDQSVDVLYEHDRLVDESFEAVVRLLDTHDALSHLVLAKPDMSDHEFREASTNVYKLAVDGTDISLESIDMSFEASENALVAVAKAIGRAIAEFFRRFLNWMSEIDIMVTVLRRRSFMMQRAAISARGRQVVEPFVSLNRLHRYLRRGHSYMQDSIRIEHELKVMLNVCKVSFGELPLEILKALDRTPTVQVATDKKLACIEIVESIPFQRLANKLDMNPVPRERFMRDNVLGTKPLIGGSSVFLFQSDLRAKGTVGLRFHGFHYAESTVEQFDYAPTREFDTLGPLDIVKMPEILIEILDAVSRASNSTTIAKVKRAKSVAENFSTRIAQDGSLSAGDRDYIRKTVNALMYWSTNISRPLGNDAISVCKAVLHYCHSSLKAQR